jgi:hypothetical protein
MSASWHIKFAAVARPAKQQFVRAPEKWVKFLILQDENPRLILSVKEGQHFEGKKGVLK